MEYIELRSLPSQPNLTHYELEVELWKICNGTFDWAFAPLPRRSSRILLHQRYSVVLFRAETGNTENIDRDTNLKRTRMSCFQSSQDLGYDL